MQSITTQDDLQNTSQYDVIEAIKSNISAKIESGMLKEGQKLPTERDLAVSYGTSRAVVRKSFDDLKRKGLITREIGRGTFVADRNRPFWSKEKFIEVSPADLAIARLMIEPTVAEYAAVHATVEDLRVITKCLDKLLSTTDPLEYDGYDSKLHTAIMAAAHSEFINYVVSAINETRHSNGWIINCVATFSSTRQTIHNQDHQAIVKALLARDPVLSGEAMRGHIQRVIQFMGGADNSKI
jgi:DNA-binding FadR family transcriptional regulator